MQGNCTKDCDGQTQKKFCHTEDNRVRHELCEIERVDERLEMFESHLRTAHHTEQGLEILEGDLRIPEWTVFEDHKIYQCGRH